MSKGLEDGKFGVPSTFRLSGAKHAQAPRLCGASPLTVIPGKELEPQYCLMVTRTPEDENGLHAWKVTPGGCHLLLEG